MCRFRHRRSSGSLRISPLHPEFRTRRTPSSRVVSARLTPLSGALSAPTHPTAYAPFTPSKSGQRLPPLSYRGCWHRVSRGLFGRYCLFHPYQKQFTTRKPSSCTRRCSVRLAPIAENSLLLPPVGVWAVLSPSLPGRPLRPGTRHRLGGPLPRQLPDGPQAPPSARCRFPPCGSYAGLADLSTRYPPHQGRLPTCSSAVRHSYPKVSVRLACIRHAASVHPEPGSNSALMIDSCSTCLL